MKPNFALALLMACPLVMGLAAKPAPAQPALPVDHIDAYIQTQMSAWQVPGAALVIVQDGLVRHLRTFGQAGVGQGVTPQTPFEIGSCSKSFTALAVMQLVEGGKLDLDALVQGYLPWFKVADGEASGRITIRHLLNQTSGLAQEDTNSLTMINPSRKTLEEQVHSLSRIPLSAAPGARYQYSNFQLHDPGAAH